MAHAPRPPRSHGVHRAGAWALKVHSLSVDGEPVDAAILDAALVASDGIVGTRPPDAVGVGYAVVHRGAEAVWLIVGTWHGDYVRQETHAAPLDDPAAFALQPAGGPTMCVWELEVIDFERRSFTRHVLVPETPARESYLADSYVE